MASSDDEGETVPETVSEYQFLSSDDESISFTVLPLEWNKGEARDGKPQQIFLSGDIDNGLRKIYKRVTAWKFDLSCKKPEILVLSAEGHWIKLLKPWKPFHDIIRTVEITLHLLHFVKWNPQRSEKVLWDHLNKTFSMFERRPCVDDLADHLHLINEAVKRDEKLANSKILSTLLVKKLWERKNSNEDVKPSFIVDDFNEEDQWDDQTDEDEDIGFDEDDCYDHMCAFCDNGGDVLICDGKCMRSFHATIEHGADSNCESLGLTNEEMQEIQNVTFLCGNCKYKEHQCFACGKLGSSDESRPEVFCCVNGTCGFFFHPECVAKLLHPGDSAAAEVLKERIASGEQFACPAHTCHVCKEVEVKSVKELQFAVCRRCPRAYHRKCLPRQMASEEEADKERGIFQRAWEGLIPNRILIYCLDHEIDPVVDTPVRDHIKFPGPWLESRKKLALESRERKKKLLLELRKRRGVALEDNAGKRVSAIPPKRVDKPSSSLVQGDISRNRVEKFPLHASLEKHKGATNGKMLGKSKQSKGFAGEISLGDKLYATFYGTDSEDVESSSVEMSQKVKPTENRTDTSLTLDADARKRILDLMEDASTSATLHQVKGTHISPSTHVQPKHSLNITFGQVEGSVQALRAALKKLDAGGRVQDAKAVCGDDLLVQVLKWKEKLKVYLAPFLYGVRYTSFGRHFTKVDKLKEIVDILHWYVQDGDMLVDFCCGSNDFSCLMKKKLDEMGKSCLYKNYDIQQAKNDFSFERRDWMGVGRDELPDGSQLIMGLNPPFGVKAALANKFINKALQFKPKLLILIVPRGTQRLDEKGSPYDLIWEDDNILVGKSFYLPGSVDANDNQIEDWNVSAPVLYLWSSPNWTPKHRAIAEQCGHCSGALKNLRSDESRDEMFAPNSADESLVMQCEDLRGDKPENSEQDGVNNNHSPAKTHLVLNPSEFGGKGKNIGGSLEDKSKSDFGGKRKKKRALHKKSEFGGNRKKNRQPLEGKPSSQLFISLNPSPKVGSHSETHSPKRIETLPQVHSARDDHLQQFNERNFSRHQPYSQSGYNGNDEMNDVVSRYYLKGEESQRGMINRPAYTLSPAPDYSFRAQNGHWFGPLDGRVNSFAEHNPWGQRAACPPCPRPVSASPYGEVGSSVMQRYAPRLDETNHASMGNMIRGTPMQDMGATYHPRGPRPPFHGPFGFPPFP